MMRGSIMARFGSSGDTNSVAVTTEAPTLTNREPTTDRPGNPKTAGSTTATTDPAVTSAADSGDPAPAATGHPTPANHTPSTGDALPTGEATPAGHAPPAGDAPPSGDATIVLPAHVGPGPEPSLPAHRHGRRWLRAVLAALIVLAFGAASTGLAWQQSQLAHLRSDVAALRAAQAEQVTALQSSLSAQRQQISALSGQLAAARSALQNTQNQLKSDEERLNIATAQLPPDLTELAARVTPSVVLVSCVSGTTTTSGTAFALALPQASGSQTTLVTAEHVVDGCTDPNSGVLSITAGNRSASAAVRAYDAENDVALLDTSLRIPPLQPASNGPVVGEFVMAVGNALGIVVNNVTSGIISQVYPTYFLDTAPISNGNSGGPVVDRSGNVLGIVDWGYASGTEAPLVENLNASLRLSVLCQKLLTGAVCRSLH